MTKHFLTFSALAVTLSTLGPASAAEKAVDPSPDPVKLVNAFEAAGGKFEGYRRSGAKGICATGDFVGSA